MSEQIRTAIADSLKPFPMVTSAWGFGSFFRGERHHDIDLLLVVAVPEDWLLNTARDLRAALMEVERRIGLPIDPLMLTEAEFKSRPLRDMDRLVRIGGNS